MKTLQSHNKLYSLLRIGTGVLVGLFLYASLAIAAVNLSIKLPGSDLLENITNGWASPILGSKDITTPINPCITISSTTSSQYFIPTRTSFEWILFQANKPSGMTMSPCVTVPINSCVTPLPTCNGVSCNLTYSPISVNQGWSKGATNCGFACTGGYTGNNCEIPPILPSTCSWQIDPGMSCGSGPLIIGGPTPAKMTAQFGACTTAINGVTRNYRMDNEPCSISPRRTFFISTTTCSCSASIPLPPVPVNGVCGIANGTGATVYPTAGHCTTGTKTDIDIAGTDGAYNWSCDGTNSGTTASCSASKLYTYSWTGTTWGTCSVLCGGGTQTRTVSCQRNDGVIVADIFCTGVKPTTIQSCNTNTCATVTCSCYRAKCSVGLIVNEPLSAYPSAGACKTDWNDFCGGGASCTLSNSCTGAVCGTPPPVPVNGVCGIANGTGATVYPTTGHCTTGAKTDIDIAGTDGAYNWSCDGTNSGTTASCSASKILPPVVGACGTANGDPLTDGGVGGLFFSDLTTTATSYGTYTQCASGTPTNTNFPAVGTTESWTCNAPGGNSVTCKASNMLLDFTGVCFGTIDPDTGACISGWSMTSWG